MTEITAIKQWLKVLVAVVFISLAIISTAAIVATRTATNVKTLAEENKKINEANNTLNKQAADSARLTGVVLANLSDYLVCLVAPDVGLYNKIGKDAYLAQCDKLLFKDTGIDPPPRNKVIDPTTGQEGK